MTDHSHLIALITRLGHERARLANARTDHERALRTVWVAQLEREIAGEEALLGIAPMDPDCADAFLSSGIVLSIAPSD